MTTTTISKAAVIGSGVMGASIAAELANAKIPTLLLDIVPKNASDRNELAKKALQRLLRQKPAPLMSMDGLEYIKVGNIEDDIGKIKEADWIIEAVSENMAVKKQLFSLVDQYRNNGSIVSSNTSGLSLTEMAAGRSADFKQHFVGAHFFNPPRYLKLLEIIPTKDTTKQTIQSIATFAENILGKGIVLAKDTPNFIANRIGAYSSILTIREMMKSGYSIGEIDSITGPLIGRPKSATFRTIDVVGLDIFINVCNTMYDSLKDEDKEDFVLPQFIQKMSANGWLGDKTGQGFYKKLGKEIFELDYHSFHYVPKMKLNIEHLRQEKLSNRFRTIMNAAQQETFVLWNILADTLLYCASIQDKIADTIIAVDEAMKWGFGWELGPYEIWDAFGLIPSVEKMKEEGKIIPEWIETMIDKGFTSFYRDDAYYDRSGQYVKKQVSEKSIQLRKKKKSGAVIQQNSGASLIDLGDGIVCLEFHSKQNAIGPDIIQMIVQAVNETEQNYAGLVIGNQGKNFCVGANLALLLMEAQDENFMEIEYMIRQFQQALLALKYCAKPVVGAPFGMTLGGGAEVCLHADKLNAASETYIGLVEVGVGLIPGGGGNKELYIRHIENLSPQLDFDLVKITNRVFETIALAKTSTSAYEAQQLSYLRLTDNITFQNDHLLYEAKKLALSLAENGYRPPQPRKIPVAGEAGYAAMAMGAQTMYYSGHISEHDLKIAKKLAYVLAGGKVQNGAQVTEQYLLDLEREAFLSLIGEPKTQQRMQHMLLKGKPLRN